MTITVYPLIAPGHVAQELLGFKEGLLTVFLCSICFFLTSSHLFHLGSILELEQ